MKTCKTCARGKCKYRYYGIKYFFRDLKTCIYCQITKLSKWTDR